MDFTVFTLFLTSFISKYVIGAQAAVDPSMALLYGPGLKTAKAGDVSTFWIQNRDANGENVTGPGDQVDVVCHSPPGKPYDFCDQDPSYENLGNGLWKVEFVVGTVWSTFADPLESRMPRFPLPSDYFMRGDNSLSISVGDPLTPVPSSPITPIFQPADDMYTPNSIVEGQMHLNSHYAGRKSLLATMTHTKDRYANIIRRPDLIDQLIPKVELLELDVQGVEPKPEPYPTVTVEWFITNWYVHVYSVCSAPGTFSFEMYYQKDDTTLEQLRMISEDGTQGFTDNFTCYPGGVNIEDTIVVSNWTDGLSVGDTVSLDAYFLDIVGNSAYLIQAFTRDKALLKGPQNGNYGGRVVDGALGGGDIEFNTTLDDVIPGLLHATYTAERPGNLTVEWYYCCYSNYPPHIIGKTDPAIYSHTLFFEELGPDEGNSMVDVSSIGGSSIVIVAGESGKIEIVLKDKNGDAKQGDSALLQGDISRDGQPLGYAVVNGTQEIGRYEMHIEGLTQAGSYNLSVTYGGMRIKEGLQQVVVEHSPDIDARLCRVRGIGIGVPIGALEGIDVEAFKQPAGRNLSVIVDAVDRFGNTHLDTSPQFKLNDEFVQECETMSMRSEGGSTRFAFTIEKKGIFFLQVTAPINEVVYGSHLEITPSGVSHQACEIFGFPSSYRVATMVEGYLRIMDKYQNLHESYPNLDEFEVSMRDVSSSPHEPWIQAQILAFDEQQGGNKVQLSTDKAGTYILSAKWEDWPINGSGFTMIAEVGITDGGATIFTPGPSPGTAGSPIPVTIETWDYWKNPINWENQKDWIITILETESGTNAEDHVSYEMELFPDEPWKTVIHLNFTKAMEYVFWIGYNRDRTRPSFYVIQPGPLSVHKSVVVGQGIQAAKALEWNYVTVIPFDSYENKIGFGQIDEDFTLDVLGSSSVQVKPFEQNATTNHTTAGYFPNEAGELIIAVAFKDAVFPGFPVRMKVEMGAISDGFRTSGVPNFTYPVPTVGSSSESSSSGIPPQASPNGEEVDEERKIHGNGSEEFVVDKNEVNCTEDEEPKCGTHGRRVDCECVCDPGWFTLSLGEDLGGVEYCNALDDVLEEPAEAPGPDPGPEQEQDEVVFEDSEQAIPAAVVIALGIGALVSFAAVVFSRCFCKKVSDSLNNASGADKDDLAHPIVHEGALTYNSEPGSAYYALMHNQNPLQENSELISAYFPEENMLWEGGAGPDPHNAPVSIARTIEPGWST